jgi:WD40 repeat protein/energy-coupling factor transporter ATP-binding protein EcfA2
MNSDDKTDEQGIQATDSGIAVGGINIEGNVSGNIQIGHNTGYTAEQVSVLITRISSTFQPKPFDGRCPYKGLDVFEEEDAELFFGREKLVGDLVSRVKDSRTVFVTGPSGSGKSSLVRAGLIHALKQGAIKGSERWLYATMKPGRDPIGELGRVVSSLASSTNPEDEIRAKAMKDAAIFARWSEIVLKEGRDKHLVLFIDQFEEVFTQISKEEERVAFLNLLTHAATIENGRVIILFSMRSDFVSNCATYPQLNALLNQQFVQIGAMQPEELVSAIAQPALRVGLRIDPDLIAQIINEMKGEPGALPLMQFALKDLFDSQGEKSGVIALTLNDYLQRGGIHKALERHADDSFSKLSNHEQKLARSIFSGLIEVGRGTQDTKRTALFDELVPANTKADEVKAVMQKLADARLVTTEEDSDKYTITHEKLIDAWPWLKRLIDENRDTITLQNEIAADAKEWDEKKQDASYLYTGGRLFNIRDQIKSNNLILSGRSNEFIQTGLAIQRKGQYLRIVGVSGIVGLVIIGILAFSFINTQNANKLAEQSKEFALTQQAIAEESQANAEEAFKQANIARSQILTINASSDPLSVQKNLLLSIEALDLVKDYALSDRTLAEKSMRDSLSQVGGIPLGGHEGAITTLAFSPDGNWLATGSADTTARLWNMNNPSAEPIVLKGHEEGISTLAFSPDGNWLATGSSDTTARLWNMRDPSGEPILLKGHEDYISTLAFSPDGNWLATGSGDNTIRLWDMHNPSGEPIVLKGHEHFIRTLAFSPDGNWLATGSEDTTARLWDMSDPSSEPIVLNGHAFITITALAFSPDGNWLATGSDDDTTASLWDLHDPSGEPIVLIGHEGSIYTLAFSPDGNWLATGSEDTTARLWDMSDPSSKPLVLNGHQGFIYTLAFSPDGNWLATGSWDTTARLWDMRDLSAEPLVLKGHERIIDTLAFSPDGNWLATGSWDTTARLWDLRNSSAESILLKGHEDYISTLAFSPDGNWLATGSYYTTASLWDMRDPSAESILLKGHEGEIYTLAFSPDGNWLATGSEDTTARLWDMSDPSGEPILLKGHEDYIYTLAFSPDGNWLATGSGDNTIRLWDMNNPSAQPIVLNGHKDSFYDLAFSPDGNWLATGSDDDTTASLWDMRNPSGEPIVLKGHEGSIYTLAFSPDGNWLATGSEDTTARLWEMRNPTGEPIILKGHEGPITTLAFSSDGNWLATGSDDDTAHLWNMNDPFVEPIILKGHDDGITALALSPDGNWLATGSGDTTARLWYMGNLSAEPIVLKGHEYGIFTLAFSPDGNWLATGSGDGTARLWNLKINYLLKKACSVVGRNFTREEWEDYFPNQEYRKTCEQWPLDPETTVSTTPTP